MKTENHKEFLSRLDKLSGGRKMTRWLSSCGLSSGTLSDIQNKDRPPSATVLNMLQRVENVCTRWLVDGIGPMYYTFPATHDDEAHQWLSNRMDDERWRIHVLTDSANRLAVVLSQPEVFLIQTSRGQDRAVSYTVIDVLTGNLGPKTGDLLNTYPHTLHVVGADFIDQLHAGQIGTYRLFGWDNTPGLLTEKKPVTTELKVAEPTATYLSDTEKLVRLFDSMNKRQRAAMLNLAQSITADDNLKVDGAPRDVAVNNTPPLLDPDAPETTESETETQPSTVNR